MLRYRRKITRHIYEDLSRATALCCCCEFHSPATAASSSSSSSPPSPPPSPSSFSYVPDTTPPELDSFDVDMNAGVVTLRFTETVDVSTLDRTAFKLQQNADSGTGGETHQILAQSSHASAAAAVVLQFNALTVVGLDNLEVYVTACRRAATTATPPPASLLLCARRPCTPPLLL